VHPSSPSLGLPQLQTWGPAVPDSPATQTPCAQPDPGQLLPRLLILAEVKPRVLVLLVLSLLSLRLPASPTLSALPALAVTAHLRLCALCSSDTAGTIWPQGLCTACFLCLEPPSCKSVLFHHNSPAHRRYAVNTTLLFVVV
jgi:hypothetical protein